VFSDLGLGLCKAHTRAASRCAITHQLPADLLVHCSTQASQAARGHHALAQLHQLGRLQRHYTLNIDGLAEVVGMDSWHHEFNPAGITVEMHGNIR
jgi:NAD-dependent SIR2 family protein deacetylase